MSWNVKELLLGCLASLFKYEARGIRYEIIVVDNASQDGTVEEHFWKSHFQKKWDFVRLIANATNRGFAAACNQGAKVAQGKVLLFLNPDCEVQEGTLQGVVQFFAEHKNAGVMGGKILNADGTVQPSVRRFPGLWDQLLILFGFQKWYTQRLYQNMRPLYLVQWPGEEVLRKYLMTDFDYSLEAEVDQVMGAFFAVPKKVFEELHGFDEKFFVWFEEVDFCKRVHKAGLKVYYSPHVAVVHRGGASFKQVNPFRRRVMWLKSLWHYFNKHGFGNTRYGPGFPPSRE